MDNLAYRNASDGFSSYSLMFAEAVFINATVILALFTSTQMFAGIAFSHSAAGPAASAKRFPSLFLNIMPLFVSVILRFHKSATTDYSTCDFTFGPLT